MPLALSSLKKKTSYLFIFTQLPGNEEDEDRKEEGQIREVYTFSTNEILGQAIFREKFFLK